MDFQLKEEFVKEHNLTEDQVKAVSAFVSSDYIPTIKKDWDSKANDNAEGIIKGAAEYAATKMGVKLDREQGEKYGDYLQRLADTGLSSKQAALQAKEAELAEKLKNFKGGDEYKAQLDTLKQEKDDLLKQVAALDPLKGLDEKYKTATEELSGLKLSVAYNGVRPNFPDTVNKYEADAKFKEWKDKTNEKFTIELIDHVAWAISKDNPHSKFKLSELLDQDASIKELMEGRKQGGTGAQQANLKDIEGVPFKVPENVTPEQKAELIRKHLNEKGLEITSQEYAKQFSELNLKIGKAGQKT